MWERHVYVYTTGISNWSLTYSAKSHGSFECTFKTVLYDSRCDPKESSLQTAEHPCKSGYKL